MGKPGSMPGASKGGGMSGSKPGAGASMGRRPSFGKASPFGSSMGGAPRPKPGPIKGRRKPM